MTTPGRPGAGEPLLRVQDLRTYFHVGGSIARAVDGVLDVGEDRTNLCVVDASGSSRRSRSSG